MAHRTKFAGLYFVFGLTLLLVVLEQAGWIARDADHWTADWRTLHFSDRRPSQHPHIAVVVIDHEMKEAQGAGTPIDRGFLATVIAAADRSSARAIGLDAVITRPTQNDKDEALLDALRTAKSAVVLGMLGAEVGLTDAQVAYRDTFAARSGRATGHLYFDTRPALLTVGDAVVRHAVGYAGPGMPRSFAEVLAQSVKPGARLESNEIAWLLPPADGTDTFLTIPADDLVARVRPGWLKDRIVLIGADFPEQDQHLTPLSVGDGARTPGVFIHAQIAAQLIDGRAVHRPGPGGMALILFGVSGLGYVLGRRYRLRRFDMLVGAAGTTVLVAAGFVSFWMFRVALPFLAPILAWGIGVTAGHYADSAFAWLGLVRTKEA